MALADRLGPLMKLLPMPRGRWRDVIDGRRNMIRQLWDLLAVLPGGKVIFSRLVGAAAPYTSTIRAHVTVLRMGHAEVEMHDRRGLRNHLDSIHAVALVNLAELAGNVALAYSLPEGARFIVSGLEIDYLKKARGTITAIGEPPVPRTNARAAFDVPVTLRDASGAEVARAVLHSLVGPTPGTRASEVELAN